jgi:hypothetical protein
MSSIVGEMERQMDKRNYTVGILHEINGLFSGQQKRLKPFFGKFLKSNEFPVF